MGWRLTRGRDDGRGVNDGVGRLASAARRSGERANDKRAAQEAQSAVRGFGPRHRRPFQFNQVHTATAKLGMGELDDAIGWAKKAVSTAKQLKSRRTVERVADFNRRLDPYTHERRVRKSRAHLREELPTATK